VLKIWNIQGNKMLGSCQKDVKPEVILTLMGEYFVVLFPTQKPQFCPLKIPTIW
jgi:hypothetical protein